MFKLNKPIASLLLSASVLFNACAGESLTDYVDPLIGTAHSRWFFFTPAAVPFGKIGRAHV